MKHWRVQPTREEVNNIMSKYTMQVRFICESTLQNKGIDISKLTVDEIIEQSMNDVFNFSFPIYDETYRPVLMHNILRHFYTQEIGAETVGRWQLFLNDRMNMIMPKYNKLYESETYKLDPLSNSSEIEKFKRDTSGTSSTNTTSESTRTGQGNNQNIYSDTPQGRLSGLDYATSLNEDTSTTTEKGQGMSNDTQNVSNLETYIRERVGLSNTSVASMLEEFMNKFKTIDLMICNELQDLFMLVW